MRSQIGEKKREAVIERLMSIILASAGARFKTIGAGTGGVVGLLCSRIERPIDTCKRNDHRHYLLSSLAKKNWRMFSHQHTDATTAISRI